MTVAANSFAQKTVVVIGGGSGFGRTVATKVVEAGGSVVLGGRTLEKLDAVAQTLGDRATTATVDIGDKASIRAFFANIPHLDHLFIPAATYTLGPIDKISDEDAESPFRTKFWGQYYSIQAALPKFAKDGSVVLMAGAAGARPGKNAAAYAAANSAIESLGRALALELAPLRLNTVSPGTIDGALWNRRPAEIRDAGFAAFSAQSALGRPGTEDEVADAVLFLMQNTFMTGGTLYTDGGYALK